MHAHTEKLYTSIPADFEGKFQQNVFNNVPYMYILSIPSTEFILRNNQSGFQLTDNLMYVLLCPTAIIRDSAFQRLHTA